MPTPRYIGLEPEQDARLREIEQDSNLRSKVRLRAQVLRLYGQGGEHQGHLRLRRAQRGEHLAGPGPLGGSSLGGAADGLGARQPTARHRGGQGIPKGEAFGAEDLERAPVGRGSLGVASGFRVSAEAIRQHLIAMGYSWKRTRYVPSKEPDPEAGARGPRRARVPKKGAFEGEIVLKYLDQSGLGISLCLPPAYSWTKRGAGEPPRGEGPGGASKEGST